MGEIFVSVFPTLVMAKSIFYPQEKIKSQRLQLTTYILLQKKSQPCSVRKNGQESVAFVPCISLRSYYLEKLPPLPNGGVGAN